MSLSNKSLAKIMAKKQILNNYPGLMKECFEILDKLGISHYDPCNFSKMSWKKITKSLSENRIAGVYLRK